MEATDKVAVKANLVEITKFVQPKINQYPNGRKIETALEDKLRDEKKHFLNPKAVKLTFYSHCKIYYDFL